MNSVIATTRSSIYLAVKHVFPEAAINAGTFEPLHIVDPDGTFLYAHYPRPVSGCAAEVSQRIAEAVFAALGQGDPRPAVRRARRHERQPRRRRLRSARRNRAYVMYVISGGGYGGSPAGDGISQRLLDDRHLEDDADRDHGAALSGAVRGVLAARRLGRRRRAPRRLRRQLPHQAAPRRRARLDGDGPRPRRPARRAGRRRRRRQHRGHHPRRHRPTCRRICRRTRTSRSTPATSSPCRRRAAAASARHRRGRPRARERDVALGYYTPEQSAHDFAAAMTGSTRMTDAPRRQPLHRRLPHRREDRLVRRLPAHDRRDRGLGRARRGERGGDILDRLPERWSRVVGPVARASGHR